LSERIASSGSEPKSIFSEGRFRVGAVKKTVCSIIHSVDYIRTLASQNVSPPLHGLPSSVAGSSDGGPLVVLEVSNHVCFINPSQGSATHRYARLSGKEMCN